MRERIGKLVVMVILGLVVVSAPRQVGSAEYVPSESPAQERIRKQLERELPKHWRSKSRELSAAILRESERHGIEARLLVAVMAHESLMNPDAVGTSGERGLMQILPKTGAWIAQKHGLEWNGLQSIIDPANSVRIGAAYLAMLTKQFNDRHLTLTAYNMGASNLRRHLARNILPKDYATKVLGQYQRLAHL